MWWLMYTVQELIHVPTWLTHVTHEGLHIFLGMALWLVFLKGLYTEIIKNIFSNPLGILMINIIMMMIIINIVVGPQVTH